MTKKEDNSDWDDATFDAINLPSQETTEEVVPKKSFVRQKKEQLSLDESATPQTKTRTAMAAEIIYNIDDEKDVVDYAPLVLRAIAGLLDYAYMYGLYLMAIKTNPFLREVIRYIMDHYHQQFIFPESSVIEAVLVLNLFFTAFFFVVIPMSFYNVTFGKILFGYRVRGIDKYSLSIIQSFQREFIFKPLSTASVIGVIWAFFSKEKQTLHDKAAQTIVVKK